MTDPLPTLAVCKKCGRGFVTIPRTFPAFDVFAPATRPYAKGEERPECGGEIELTDAGRADPADLQ